MLGKDIRQGMFGQLKGYSTAYRDRQGVIERTHHPPISSKIKLQIILWRGLR